MTYGNYAVDYEQRAYNPERMRKERLERAQASLLKFGLGAMVVYSYDSHRYLGYYSTHQYARRRPGTFLLLIRDAGWPYVPEDPRPPAWEEYLAPWFKGRMKLKTSKQFMVFQGYPQQPDAILADWDKTAAEIKGLLVEHGVENLPCGVDMTNLHMIRACERAGINIVDGNHVMVDARMIKTQDEIECLRMAGVITESAHWEVCRALRPGVTEWEMAGVASNALFKLGAEEMEGPSFVICSGDRTAKTVPAMPTDRIVRPGDLFVIDINGISFQGYRTCFYRTYCVGDKPTEAQQEVYDVTYRCLKALEDTIKPGITNHQAHLDWLKLGDAPGLWGRMPEWPAAGRYFNPARHHIGLCSGDPGPGIGRYFESSPPLMLEKNMTFAVEVGVFTWDGNQWARDGAKLENCGVVTDTGFEVFYRFPYKDLITVGLPGVY